MTMMILILLAAVIAAWCGRMLFIFAENEGSVFAGILAMILAFGSGITLVCYAFTIWSWFASEHKAAIINREYGTDYTREEVFFASSVIDTVRELDRKRIEVNGNILTGKERTK